MEKKFTPGPWFVSQAGQFNPLHVSNESEFGKQKNTNVVCFLNNTGPQGEERTANAHLIAAAPKLYELLDECRYNASMPKGLLADIEKALAQARGEG